MGGYPLAGRRHNPSGDTARTLLLVGLVLQLIFALIFLGFSVLTVVLIPLGVIPLIFVFLVYFFSYARIRDGEYGAARTPTLIFAILSLVVLSLIPGICYLIAYVKVSDAASEQERAMQTPYGYPPPAPTFGAPPAAVATVASASATPSSHPAYPSSASAAACPRCGQALMYVPQYARWYCPNERVYV